MKHWLRGLFSENGGVSMIRVLSLLCTVSAVIIAMAGISSTKHTLESVAILCGTFLTAGLGAKVLQKKTEVAQSEKLLESVQDEDKK